MNDSLQRASGVPASIYAALARAQDSTLAPQRRLAALGWLAAETDALFVNSRLDNLAAFEALLPDELASPHERFTVPVAPQAVDTHTEIVRRISTLLDDGVRLLRTELLPALAHAGHDVVRAEQLSVEESCALKAVFRREIFPLLMPLAVDPGRPFPKLASGQLNLLIRLRPLQDESLVDERLFAVIRVPATLPRLVQVPGTRTGVRRYLWLEDLITHRQADLFPGMQVVEARLFRVLRRARADAEAVRSGAIAGPIIRLDIETGLTWDVRHWLMAQLHLPSYAVLRTASPLALADLVDAERFFPQRRIMLWALAERAWHAVFGHIRG